MGVDLIVEESGWDVELLEALAAGSFNAVAAHLNWPKNAYEIALLACNDARIAELNTEFRGKPTPTNVLSWPSEERDAAASPPAPGELGDIAIAFETCRREALEQGKEFTDHVTHLIVHAILHLLGHDHENEQDAATMEELEVEILATLGIADPY